MRVFVTGATGFIGSHLVPELIAAGHEVTGLTRSSAGEEALRRVGATPTRGDVNDQQMLRQVVATADAVIHTAFDHDPTDQKRHSEEDRQVIAALGEALDDPSRPLIITSGTGLVVGTPGVPVGETDPHPTAVEVARAASEEAADALIEKGRAVIVMRLPQVHDARHQGRLRWHIDIARQQGRVAYVGAGENRVPAAHVSDVARLYRLALEHGTAGSRYHAVAEEGVPLRRIAEAIGTRLNLPVDSITPDEARAYFGWLSQLAVLDLPASSARTREQLGWTPTGPGLLADLTRPDAD
jgi:nucleoside-diphosphate-sugar epimerase